MQTILIADWDHAFAATLNEFLQLEGYATLCARDEVTCLHLAQENHVDLIVYNDHRLDQQGTSFVQRLREKPFNQCIPILYLTNTPINKLHWLKEQPQIEILRSPFSPTIFLERLQKLLAYA